MDRIFQILFSPITLIRFILVWIVSLFFWFAVIIENKVCKKPGSFKFWSARYWARTLLFVLGIWTKRNKITATQNYLLMPNHRSWVDILLMAAYSPSAFVAKAEIAKWPILGPAVKSSRAILVQRDKMQSLITTMKKINESIQMGTSVTIFPEGTTFKGSGTLPFKNGSFKIAAENNIPIIPCAIEYRNKEMRWISKDTFIGHFIQQMWKPYHLVEIRFSEPIIGNDFIHLKSKTHSAINTMLNEMS